MLAERARTVQAAVPPTQPPPALRKYWERRSQVPFIRSPNQHGLMDKIELTQELPFAPVGESTSSDSCLFRVYSKLVKSGKPAGKLNYIFYSPQDSRTFTCSPQDNKTFTLGTLCYTPGRQLLFFPGFTADAIHTFAEHDPRPLLSKSNFPIDHFTLEKSHRRWHITSTRAPDGKEYIKPLRVHRVSESFIHWFSVSIQDEGRLQETRRVNRMVFPCPASDADRRLSELTRARDGAIFHILHLPDESIPRKTGEFLHFDFWIDLSPTGQDLSHPSIRPPTSSNVVQYQTPLPKKSSVRSHRVRVVDFPGAVIVIASKHKGALKYPEVITCFAGE